MTIKPKHGNLVRRITAVGLGMLLIVVGLSPVTEAGEWIRSDWSKVQRIALGARTRVRLYKDRAPGKVQKVEGQLQSASAEAIMLLLPSGQTLTFQKQAVEKILVYRPIEKRYQGWITAAASTAFLAGAAVKGQDNSEPLHAGVAALFVGLFIGAPTAIAFLVAPRWGGIYNVPPDRRNDTSQAPPQQSSSVEIPVVTQAERIRLQARRAVMKQGLPLQLPARSLYSAEEDIKHAYGAASRVRSGEGQVKSIALKAWK